MKYQEYHSVIKEQLERQFDQEGPNIEKAAEYCAASVSSGRVIHVFGCGHSQMFAMEVFYRAGVTDGQIRVPVSAGSIQTGDTFVYDGAEGLTAARAEYVREENGYYIITEDAGDDLELEDVDSRDTMIIVSISGRNAGVVDMALEAKKIGMKVVTLVSKQFAGSTTSRHSSGKNLMEVADVVIDIKCVAGDAALEMEGLEPHFCGTSTVLGMSVMESIVAQTVENCVKAGYLPPIYVSSNLDKGDAINDEHIKKYSKLISCL